MKKTIIAIFSLTLIGISYANTQLDTSIHWMHENGLTKFSSPTDFMASKSLRRDEAAKFFVQYAKQQLNKSPDTSKKECDSFSDLDRGHSDLLENVKDACKLGLFRGSQGKFMPDEPLTNGQALTVLMRMLDGMKDESKGHFATLYFQKAVSFGITQGVNISASNFDNLATRGDVSILLYNATHMKTEQTHNTPSAQVDERFSQCKKVTGLPIDYSSFTGPYSGQFIYVNTMIQRVNETVSLTNSSMECSTTNQYLRSELIKLRLMRKQITSGFIAELKAQIYTNNLYINAIADPNTTVIIEYNTCIDYNTKVAINKTLGADTTGYKNCGKNPVDAAIEMMSWNHWANGKILEITPYLTQDN